MPTGASAPAASTPATSTEVSQTQQSPQSAHKKKNESSQRLMFSLLCWALGGQGEEEKEGSVMVEFDDGDRGRISLVNIRLLPPGYQIRCECGFDDGSDSA